jgi:hypothetical protein
LLKDGDHPDVMAVHLFRRRVKPPTDSARRATLPHWIAT